MEDSSSSETSQEMLNDDDDISSIEIDDINYMSTKNSPMTKKFQQEVKRTKGYDDSKVFFSTELGILMPGDKLTIVERFAIATPRCFQYYSRKRAHEQEKAPLYSIWLKDIKEVKLAEIQGQRKKGIEYFEIILGNESNLESSCQSSSSSEREV